MTAIFTLDPGKASGWALWVDGAFQSGELQFDQICTFMNSTFSVYGQDLTVISEAFVITMQTVKNTPAPWSLEVIGVARYLCHVYCSKDLVMQQPAAAKRFASNERLKLMGWYKPGAGHDNDAARHLLLALATRRILDDETLKSLV